MSKSRKRLPAKAPRGSSAAEKNAALEAINRSQAVIEFDLDSTVLAVNEHFLALTGYERKEVVGQPQSLFVDASEEDRSSYRQLWENLRLGQSASGRFRIVGKGAREIWIRANFNALLDRKGKPFRVVQYSADITANKAREIEIQGRLNAINRSQASVEYLLDGTIVTANENFLAIFGYTLEEIRGKHHSVLVGSDALEDPEYRSFWESLGRGECLTGQYRRIGKDGREIWVHGTYSPILDAHGVPQLVIAYGNDITEQRHQDEINAAYRGALENVTTNIMVADADHKIMHMNASLRSMLAAAQEEFRKELPDFDVNGLIGSSMDAFHRNPSHQRDILGSLTKTHVAQFKIAGRVIRVIASPMVNPLGKRLGSVIEWADRTVELAVETELKKLVGSANEGDLTQRMALSQDGSVFAEIGKGVNQLIVNMEQIVSRVQVVAKEVSRGADELSEGNAHLSERTEEQASSLEQTASSMEQMTSTVKQNADNASRASELASAARDQADRGGAVVSNAVRAMTEINDSSRKIVEIISVIDEIAFQTNLLALNAAVEAARAGEQGRGFAVVASEVRNLAGRSATAAKEIKGLIQDSVKKVEEGSSLVTQSGQTLDQIVQAVKKASDIIGEIAGASHEQSAGIDQVNKAIMHLDGMTQQNAALVEEASASSHSMSEQARALADLITRYKVSTPGSEASVAPATQPVRSAAGEAAKAERRAAGRPWGGAEQKSTALSRVRASNGSAVGADAEWKEF